MKKSNLIVDSESRILVVGLGRSGIAVAKLLRKMGAVVTAVDSGPRERIDQDFLAWATSHGVGLKFDILDDGVPPEVDLIVISPGVPDGLPFLAAARERGIPVIGEMALAAGMVSAPIIAITGTNGKSTVTELIGEMFRAAGQQVFVGGNLGQPLSEFLLEPYPVAVLVLEVSSFQLDTAPEFRPDVGILLNISPDHLDRYDDYEHYARAKFAIFRRQTPKDAAILNADDPEITDRLAAGDIGGRIFFFGRNCGAGDLGATVDGQELLVMVAADSEVERYSLKTGALGLEPNVHNSAAAVIAARLLDCPADAVRRALANFKPLEHRLAEVAVINGVRYLDDSKATNIGAVAAALAGMDRPVVLIAGGRDKGGDYRLLHDLVGKKVKGMVLIGEAREKMAQAFAGITRVEFAEDLPGAVGLAGAMAARGDIVLLSPACASFDMFKSYSHRGRVFREAVLALAGSGPAPGPEIW